MQHMTTPEQRWRIYVLPFHAGQNAGYIEALTPLGQLDASIQAFRFTLLVLGLASLLVARVWVCRLPSGLLSNTMAPFDSRANQGNSTCAPPSLPLSLAACHLFFSQRSSLVVFVTHQ